MKNLYEGILDDQDDIMDVADLAASREVIVTWLQDHGIKFRLDDIRRGKSTPWFDADTNTLTLQTETLILGKNDEVPDYIKIKELQSLLISGYDGDTLPEITKAVKGSLTIRNCPKLKSLKNCPTCVKIFAVSNCPQIKSLDGCPQVATKLFKVFKCGKKFDAKEIKRHCSVNKKNMIYEAVV